MNDDDMGSDWDQDSYEDSEEENEVDVPKLVNGKADKKEKSHLDQLLAEKKKKSDEKKTAPGLSAELKKA